MSISRILKKSKDYSTIEGCIRQTTNNPIQPCWRIYADDEMILASTQPSDHEYMDWKMARESKYLHEVRSLQPGSEETTQASDSSL